MTLKIIKLKDLNWLNSGSNINGVMELVKLGAIRPVNEN